MMLSGKKQNKIITLLLILIAIMLLVGCEKNEEENRILENTGTREKTADVNIVSKDGNWQGEGGCYKLSLAEKNEETIEIYTDGEAIYTLDYVFDNDSVLMKIYQGKESIYQSSSIRTMALAKQGVWILEDVTDYSAGNDSEYHLLQVESGTEKPFEMDITQFMGESFPTTMRMDRDGKLFIMLTDSVIIFDEDGTYLSRIVMETRLNKLIAGGDGKVYVRSGDRDVVFGLDVGAESAIQVAEFPGYRICDGGGDYFFTLVNDDGLYGVREIGGNTEAIALWAELGISFVNLSSVQIMSEGRFLLKDNSGDYILRPAEPSEIKQKTILTIASMDRWPVNGKAVMDFNFYSDDYTVKILNYSQAGKLSTEEAIVNLNKDIISGNYPDMFDFSMLPESYYTDKGLVADIYEFMDQDPDVERDDFILLDKIEREGKLFYAARCYNIDTAAGLWTRFGDHHGWSLDEYLEIQSQYSGEIIYNIIRENFLRILTYRYTVSAVDWKAGTCDFETEEFLKILKTTASIRENPEPENPAELDFTPGGVRLSQGTLIVNMCYVDNVRALAEAEQEAGERLSFIGRPTPDGSGGSQIIPSGLTGICAMGDKEGAWEFIKFLMTEGAKSHADYGISVNRSVLEEQIEEAMNPSEEEEGTVIMDSEDVERLYELMEHSVYYGTADDKVVNIVLEEASAFLAGAKSAEDTAHVIQSRVGLLVAE